MTNYKYYLAFREDVLDVLSVVNGNYFYMN
jgi:hypothetical protein